MAWVTPVTDRALADLAARNAKAFLNVADWERIDGNTSEVQAQILSLLGTTVTLVDLTAPTMTTIPSAEDINTLVENIEAVRIGAALGIAALDHDYQPGIAATAPDYQAVNDWEDTLLQIHTLLPLAADYVIYSGVANVGQDRLWQARFR